VAILMGVLWKMVEKSGGVGVDLWKSRVEYLEAFQVLHAKIVGMMLVLDGEENYEHMIWIFIWWIGIGCTTMPQAPCSPQPNRTANC